MLFQKPKPDYSFFPTPKLIEYPTPYFVISHDIVAQRHESLSNLLSIKWGKHQIAYSFKTNYKLALNHNFNFAEVVSQNELLIAKSINYPSSKIIINGPNKGDLSQLLNTNITINIDNFSELEQIQKYPHKIKSKIGIRLNSSVHSSRFGFNIENGNAKKALIQLSQANVNLSGIHFHIGSDIQDHKDYQLCSTQIANFININSLQNKLDYLDLGGGFPSHGNISGSNTQAHPVLSEYLDSIITPLKKIFIKKLPVLILEPGRYLVDDATYFVTKVLDVKNDHSTQIVTVDSTINMLPSTWYRPNLIKPFRSQNTSTRAKTIIFGGSCQETDLLFKGEFEHLNTDDYIVFYCVGAYNQSQSSDFIFRQPPTYFIPSNGKMAHESI